MIATFTARFTKIDSGYMGELIEWPDVITEGADLGRLPKQAGLAPKF